MKNIPRRLRKIFTHIKQRCYNPKREAYKHYGGRGIKVCKYWLDNPLNFYIWSLHNGYSDNLTIDRIDNDGDYSPENCRWVDIKTQSNNKRTNKKIEIYNKIYTIATFCDTFNLNRNTVWSRLQNGKKDFGELSAIVPVGKKRKYLTIDGETKSIIEWCELYNIKKTTVMNRIKIYGYSPKEALTKPLRNGKNNKLLSS